MSNTKLDILLNKSLIELKDYVDKYTQGEFTWPETAVKKVLDLLKDDMSNNVNPNDRLLSAFHDIMVVSLRNHSDTELYQILKALEKEISIFFPKYLKLEPLRLDFGKGNPI